MPLKSPATTPILKILCAATLLAPMIASAHLIAIAATTPFPNSVNTSSSTSAVYTVTNISTIPLTGIEDQSSDRLPNGMSISASTCSSTSALNPGASCTINLQLAAPTTATVLSGGLYEHPLPSADGVFSAIGPINVITNTSTPVPIITVGTYVNGAQSPLAYTRAAAASAAWVVALPTKQGNSTSNNTLAAVSCSSDKQYCSTVGSYTNASGQTIPLSYTSANTGATWTVSTGLPAAQGTTPTSRNGTLLGIACDSTGQDCSAVGYYADSSGINVPVSYISTNFGVSWSISTTQPASQGTTNQLFSVACDAAGANCATVGYYTINGMTTTFPSSFTSLNGGVTWTVSSTPPPQQGTGNNQLFAVACGSTTGQYCTAVGYYTLAGVKTPLAYYSTDAGVTWHVSVSSATLAGTEHSLKSVACSSSGQNCTAVGQYLKNVDGVAQSVPESYYSTDGGRNWHPAATQPAAQGAGVNQLNGVTCDSSGVLCTAVGYYTLTGSKKPLSYTSANGGIDWTISAPLPTAQGPTASNNVLNSAA